MGIIIATLLVLVAIASVVAQDFTIFSWGYWQEEEGGDTSRSEVFRNFGLFLAAGIALVFAFWRAKIATRQAKAAAERADAAIDQARAANEQARAANAQADTAEQGHITERFSRAVEQLGHDRVAVRIGGLYALKRIAEDSVERDHLAVMDVLTNFIRHPPYADAQREAAEQEKARREFIADPFTSDDTPPPPPPEFIDCPDIVAAIEIIQGRSEDQKAVEEKREYRLPLSRARLSYLRLPGVDLQIFALTGANLTGTELTRANLSGASLKAANLSGANLVDAKLTDANLSGADLSGADLTGAEFTDANLLLANLTSANLRDANLTGANLRGAKLTDANLWEADLKGAKLSSADLSGANLSGADLGGVKLTLASLTGANLSGASNLTQDQLDSACIRKGGGPPALPEGLKPPQKICLPRPQ